MKFLNNIKNQLALMAFMAKSDQKNIDRVFTRVFSSEDGQKVLAYLYHITSNHVMAANASEAQLRHAEGQKALIQTIQKLTARGRSE